MISRPKIIMHKSTGFSLIEALATVVILGVVATVSSGIILNASDSYLSATTSAQLNAELAIGLERASREIRNIILDSGASGTAPDIDSLSANSIRWTTNNRLQLTGSNIELIIDGTPAVLLSDVTSFQIHTFDESNVLLGQSITGAACDAVRRVQLTITVSRNGVSETLRTRIFLRATS